MVLLGAELGFVVADTAVICVGANVGNVFGVALGLELELLSGEFVFRKIFGALVIEPAGAVEGYCDAVCEGYAVGF
jgi:hypothetical protein